MLGSLLLLVLVVILGLGVLWTWHCLPELEDLGSGADFEPTPPELSIVQRMRRTRELADGVSESFNDDQLLEACPACGGWGSQLGGLPGSCLECDGTGELELEMEPALEGEE